MNPNEIKDPETGFICSIHAHELLQKGFTGNGCGSGMISKLLCTGLERLFKVEIVKSWKYHDAEYSVSRAYKGFSHRTDSDKRLHHNLLLELGLDPDAKERQNSPNKLRFAALVHAALTLKGENAYWDQAPSGADSMGKIIVIASSISYVMKHYF